MVTATAIRDMMGLADRAQTIELFALAMEGKAAEALKAFATLYGFGADPVVVMLDLLDHAHAASVAKALGPGRAEAAVGPGRATGPDRRLGLGRNAEPGLADAAESA